MYNSMTFICFTANPNNVLHMNARYVNDSAILAEMYREENSRKIVDSLLALRLNTSRLLHSRLHWRPTMLQDIKVILLLLKMPRYKIEIIFVLLI